MRWGRMLFLFWMLVPCILSGCSSGALPLPEKMAEPILTMQCNALVKQEGNTFSCLLSRRGTHRTELLMTDPKAIDGMRFQWMGDSFSVTYEGLSAESDECILPLEGFPPLLKEILDAASEEDALSLREKNEYVGNVKGEAFSLLINPETGYIEEIRLPSRGLTAFLSNQKQIN